MYNYKCDRCGIQISIDPGEPRMCDRCLELERQDTKPVKMVYQERKREAAYAG